MSSDTEQSNLTERELDQLEELQHKPFDDLSTEEITSKIRLSVKRRLSFPEWLLYFEFTAPNGRRADCIAVNTMPSRNHKIRGFEFKASRSDWLKEKRTGEKADYFVDLCDEWYLVAPKDVIEKSEVPEGWGYLQMKPGSEQLWEIIEADPTEYQARKEPDRRFWTRFMKNIVGEDSNFTKQDIKESERRGYERGIEENKQQRITSDREFEQLEEKAENYDKIRSALNDHDVYLSGFGEIREDKARAIAAGFAMYHRLDDESFHLSNFQGILDSFEEDVEKELDRFQAYINALRISVEKVADGVSDEGGDA